MKSLIYGLVLMTFVFGCARAPGQRQYVRRISNDAIETNAHAAYSEAMQHLVLRLQHPELEDPSLGPPHNRNLKYAANNHSVTHESGGGIDEGEITFEDAAGVSYVVKSSRIDKGPTTLVINASDAAAAQAFRDAIIQETQSIMHRR